MQTTKNKKPNNSETVEVLYQKLGGRWYAFSLIDNEVFMGSVSQEEIDAPEARTKKRDRVHPVMGHS
ncbi:hypothetical protein WDW86_09595 [Bdellovibrionota bacterium FG-2]